MVHHLTRPHKHTTSLPSTPGSPPRKPLNPGRPALTLIALLLPLLIALPSAFAQQPTVTPPQPTAATASEGALSAPKTVVWLLSARGLQTDEDKTLAASAARMFQQILKGSQHTHVIAAKPDDLARWLSRNSQPVPPCLEGQADCDNPRQVGLQALGGDMLLIGELGRDGANWTFNVVLYGDAGNLIQKETFTSEPPAPDTPKTSQQALEEVAFKAASTIFKSTGTLEITTDPPGASVRVNNERVGTSPLSLTVPIGIHTIEANLENFGTRSTTAKVGAGRDTRVSLALTSQAASVVIDTGDIQGAIFIEGKKVGETGQPLDLLPGDYQIEIRANDHKPRTVRALIAPNENKVMSLTLEPDRPSLNLTGLGEVETEAILARHYFFRGAYRFTRVVSGLADAEGTFEGRDVTLQSVNLETDPESEAVRPDFGYHGLHLDLGYTWENWGVVALGLSFFSSGDDTDGVLKSGDTEIPAKLTDFSRIELKPAQLMWRYPYKNLLPSVQTGFGYGLTSFTAEGNQGQGSGELEQDELFWHFSIEVSYFFDAWWFTYAAVGLHRDLIHDDSKTQQLLTIGAGLTFENPLDEITASSGDAPPKTQ